MKYGLVVIWALLMGQMCAYLGSKLSHTGYDPLFALFGSLAILVVVFIIGEVTSPKKDKKV